ncbi:tRNA (adenine(22)-N(1))-methyltransferase [Marinicrinis sediminis]|uniref:tRNA (Adenine(22)-N(1))-methyltransferase n=1 Tax=Marinicrinis sediminis TaxID=1652465 RepID=A0ABW5RBD3_9BACL
MIRISRRLLAIASYVKRGSRVADIGSDHALLPIYLIQQGIALHAWAGEVNLGPMRAARRNVQAYGQSEHIEVRHGNGLDVLSEDDQVDCITIAGMGGGLIVEILQAGREKLAAVKQLVLQPNVGEEAVRRWLVQNGWKLETEEILKEDGKIYEILSAVRAEDAEIGDVYPDSLTLSCGLAVTQDELFQYGPYLIQHPASAWLEKWQSETHKMEKILVNMAQSEQPEAISKREQFAHRLQRIKEVVHCLQKEQR